MCAKSKYNEVVVPMLDKIRAYAAQGKTRADICHDLLHDQITTKSLRRYAVEHPELKAALAEGQATAAGRMADSLFRAGEGFHYEETRTTYDEEGNIKEVVVYKRYAKPDSRAAHLWLINMDRENWTTDGKQPQQADDAAAGGGIIQIPAIDAAGFEAERQAELARLEAAQDE